MDGVIVYTAFLRQLWYAHGAAQNQFGQFFDKD